MNKTTSGLVTSQFQSQILAQLLENQKAFVEERQFYSRTWAEFRQRELQNYMNRETGKKRLRKKKALKRMKEVWAMYILARPVSHMVNYHELAKKLFPVQPLPGGATPIYSNHVDDERSTVRGMIKESLKRHNLD